MTDHSTDGIRDLLARAMSDAPEPHAWAEVEQRSRQHDARRALEKRHKSSLGPWRPMAAAAVVFLVVAVVAARDQRDTVTATDVPTSSLLDGEASDAFDRGRNETLVLDPDTDERLRGVVVSSLDGEADAVAVAADGAVGLLEGTTLRIVADGVQLASREFDRSGADSGWGRDSIAFDTEGTLWVWTGDGVAGLRGDGSSVDVDDVVPPVSSGGGGAGLRIAGVNVSVVLYDLDRPSWAEVIAVVGDDPLEGVRTVDTPVTGVGVVPHPGTPYLDGPRAVLTSEVLLSGSIVGSTRAELNWTDPPSDAEGYLASGSDSQIVADTAASLLSMSIYDGSFLVVDRSDGVSAVAIVAAGAFDQVSVSPDGAVHLVTIADGSTTVRTLLDADLRPLAAPSVDADDGASADGATTVTAPSTTTPKVSELGPDAASLGESVLLGNGHLARVNAVVEDAPIRNSFDRPTLDAPSITEIEVEHCIGEEPTDFLGGVPSSWGVELASRWRAVLDDGSISVGRPGHYPPLVLQPGGCRRGFIAFPTPLASTVVGASYTDDRRGLPPDTTSWDLSKSQSSEGPLQLPISPPAVVFGEPMTVDFQLDVTVVEIIDNAEPKPSWTNIENGTPAEPLAPGRKKVEIRAQVCAHPDRASDRSSPRELQWFIVTDDNYIGTAETFDNPDGKFGPGNSFPTSDEMDSARGDFFASSLVFDDRTDTDLIYSLAPGECAAGYVQIDLPSEATPTDVVIAAGDYLYWEIGRTRLST